MNFASAQLDVAAASSDVAGARGRGLAAVDAESAVVEHRARVGVDDAGAAGARAPRRRAAPPARDRPTILDAGPSVEMQEAAPASDGEAGPAGHRQVAEVERGLRVQARGPARGARL